MLKRCQIAITQISLSFSSPLLRVWVCLKIYTIPISIIVPNMSKLPPFYFKIWEKDFVSFEILRRHQAILTNSILPRHPHLGHSNSNLVLGRSSGMLTRPNKPLHHVLANPTISRLLWSSNHPKCLLKVCVRRSYLSTFYIVYLCGEAAERSPERHPTPPYHAFRGRGPDKVFKNLYRQQKCVKSNTWHSETRPVT